VMMGILCSLMGALALSVSTEFILTTFDLPQAIRDIANWTWPPR